MWQGFFTKTRVVTHPGTSSTGDRLLLDLKTRCDHRATLVFII